MKPVGGVALVLTSLVLGLGLLEVAIRTYSAFFFPRMMQFDETLGWSHRPSVEKTFVNPHGEDSLVVQNAFGLRGTSPPEDRATGKYRVLALGDSFTEGVQVGEEDLFTRLMEEGNARLEVLNAGVGSYGTVQQYLYLKTRGLTFRPDHVLLMFYPNDLSENCLSYSPAMGPRPYAIDDGDAIRVVEALDETDYLRFALPAPFQMALHRHSVFYLFLNTRVYQVLFAEELRSRHRENLASLKASCRSLEVFFDLVRRVELLAEQSDAELSVVLIPQANELEAGRSEVSQAISDRFAQEGIDHLSLLEALTRGKAAGAAPYFETDIHWTKEGHRIAAREILELLSPRLAEHAGAGKE